MEPAKKKPPADARRLFQKTPMGQYRPRAIEGGDAAKMSGRAAHREPVDAQRGHAHANRNALALFATGAYARIQT